MATISLYNQTRKKFSNNEVTLANVKVMLLDDSATYTASDTNISAVSSNQVSGNGWTSGGEAIGSLAWSIVNTNEAKLDGTDVSATASGGSIGPAYKAAIYDSGTSDILFFIDFGGSKEAAVGTSFLIRWHANGIYTVTA